MAVLDETARPPSAAVDTQPHQPEPSTSAVPARTLAALDTTPSRRFLLPRARTYAPQYAHIYFCRLQQLRPHAVAAAQAAFGPPSSALFYADTLADAASAPQPATDASSAHGASPSVQDADKPANTNGDDSADAKGSTQKDERVFTVVTGLVFRQMKAKPSILALYEKPSPTHLIPPPPSPATSPFATPQDTIFFEDSHARCALDLTPLHTATTASARAISTAFVTGVVLALRGLHHHATGVFAVHAFTHVRPAPQKPLPSPSPSRAKRTVCLVSSLGLSPSAVTPDLLLETLRGTVGVPAAAASIAHAFVVGNLSPATESQPPADHAAVPAQKAQRISDSMSDSDRFLASLATALPVTVMPGEGDAANALLPQQPLHRCLLPNASRCANLHRAPNPSACTVGSTFFVGTSGQNVRDVALYDVSGSKVDDGATSDGAGQTGGGDKKTEDVGRKGGHFEVGSGEQVLDILEALVRHRHLAPTCPDTLGCYPFTENDPFVMDATPHVFFVGNQREFATRLLTLPPVEKGEVEKRENGVDAMEVERPSGEDGGQVRLISVPRFDKTGIAVFVDVDTLDTTVQSFQVC